MLLLKLDLNEREKQKMLTYNATTMQWEGVTGGVDVVELAQRKLKPTYQKEQKQKKTQNEIRSQIENHHIYGYADKLSRKILSEYGYDSSKNKVIFTNKQVSCFYSDRNFWQVKFSYHSLEDSFENGFCEYFTVAHIWARAGFEISQVNYSRNKFFELFTKNQAVWAEVLHELAHFVDMIENKNQSKPHGASFQQALSELITLYPFEEC